MHEKKPALRTGILLDLQDEKYTHTRFVVK